MNTRPGSIVPVIFWDEITQLGGFDYPSTTEQCRGISVSPDAVLRLDERGDFSGLIDNIDSHAITRRAHGRINEHNLVELIE